MELSLCCGTTCCKGLLEKELKCEGATEFVAYLEANVTEDMSTEAINLLLQDYTATL